MTIEDFLELKEQARSDFRRGRDRFEVLEFLIFEYEINEEKRYKQLEKSVKGCNLYKAINIFGKDALEEICKDKINNFEQRSYFRKLKRDYVDVETRLLTEAEIENAQQTDVSIIFDNNNIEYHKGRSDCPFCGEGIKGKTKFSFKNNLYYCFKCGKKGNTIRLAMDLFGYNFKEAVRYINQL